MDYKLENRTCAVLQKWRILCGLSEFLEIDPLAVLGGTFVIWVRFTLDECWDTKKHSLNSTCVRPIYHRFPIQMSITSRPRSFAVNDWSTFCKFDKYAEFADFPNRLGSSLKVIHLYHHGSELIKLPWYEICPPSTTLFKTSIKSYYKYYYLNTWVTDMRPLEFTIMIKPFSILKAQFDLITNSNQEVSYFRLFEYQWFVVNH